MADGESAGAQPGSHRSAGDEPSGSGRSPRRRLVRRIVGVLVVVVLGLVGADALSGSGTELAQAADGLRHVNLGWLAVAIVVEAFSYLCWGLAERRLLRAGESQVGLGAVTAQVVAAQALADVLPAGLALSTVASWRWLRRLGVDDSLAVWMLAASSTLYVGVLAVLTLVGSEVAGGAATDIPDLRPVAAGVVGVLAAVALAVVVLARRGMLAQAATGAARLLSRLHIGSKRLDVAAGVARLSSYRPGRAGWVISAGWLAGAWLADTGCLALAFYALGSAPPWRGLLLAYGAAQLAATLPITPGGLGVVEGSLTVALVAFGGGTETTLTAVLLYRLVSFWAILPSGGVCYGVLRALMRRRAGQRRVAVPQPVAVGAQA